MVDDIENSPIKSSSNHSSSPSRRQQHDNRHTHDQNQSSNAHASTSIQYKKKITYLDTSYDKDEEEEDDAEGVDQSRTPNSSPGFFPPITPPSPSSNYTPKHSKSPSKDRKARSPDRSLYTLTADSEGHNYDDTKRMATYTDKLKRDEELYNKQHDLNMFTKRLRLLIAEGDDPDYKPIPTQAHTPGLRILSGPAKYRPSTTGSIIQRNNARYDSIPQSTGYKKQLIRPKLPSNTTSTTTTTTINSNVDPDALFDILAQNEQTKECDKQLQHILSSIYTTQEVQGLSYTHSYSIFGRKSALEEAVSTEKLLEASIFQRQSLVMPIGLREAEAYCNADKLHLFSPQTMSAAYFTELIEAQQQLPGARKYGKLKLQSIRGWKMYSILQPVHRTSHLGEHYSDNAADGVKQRWYVHEGLNIVQRGEPFDLKSHRLRTHLKEVDTDATVSHLKKPSDLTLLEDKSGGFLFYEPETDSYHHPVSGNKVRYDSCRNHVDVKLVNSPLISNTSESITTANINMASPTSSSSRGTGRRPGTSSGTRPSTTASSSTPPNRDLQKTRSINRLVDTMMRAKGIIMTDPPPPDPDSTSYKHTAAPEPQRLVNSPDQPTIWSLLLLSMKQRSGTAAPNNRHPSSSNGRLPQLSKEWGFASNPASSSESRYTPFFPSSSSSGSYEGQGLSSLDISEKVVLSLAFERTLTDAQYIEYSDHLRRVKATPRNPLVYYNLSLYLIQLGPEYGKYAVSAMSIGLEWLTSIGCHSTTIITLAKLTLRSLKAKYLHIYEHANTILSIIQTCPESEMVLIFGGFCLRLIGCDKMAEKMVLGALLLNCESTLGLRLYAHMLYERSDNIILQKSNSNSSTYQSDESLTATNSNISTASSVISTAKRYLGRVKDDSSSNTSLLLKTKLDMLWLSEVIIKSSLVGQNYDQILSAYNSFASDMGIKKCEPSLRSLFYRSLGSFYNRSDALSPAYTSTSIPTNTASSSSNDKGLDHLQRAYSLDPFDPVTALFLACNPSQSLSQRESYYRRALVTMHPKSSNLWIGLLATADFLLAHSKDDHQAGALLWAALQVSWSQQVWPAIALAHFYQYTRGEPQHGIKILLFACRSRRHW